MAASMMAAATARFVMQWRTGARAVEQLFTCCTAVKLATCHRDIKPPPPSAAGGRNTVHDKAIHDHVPRRTPTECVIKPSRAVARTHTHTHTDWRLTVYQSSSHRYNTLHGCLHPAPASSVAHTSPINIALSCVIRERQLTRVLIKTRINDTR